MSQGRLDSEATTIQLPVAGAQLLGIAKRPAPDRLLWDGGFEREDLQRCANCKSRGLVLLLRGSRIGPGTGDVEDGLAADGLVVVE